MMPPFDVQTGHLPVGRYSCTPEEAQQRLVHDPGFKNSSTRVDLWLNFERYIAKFFALEEKYQDILTAPVLDRVWLGGSFVSAKLDPNNVDATLIINRGAKDALRGKAGTGLFARSRDSVKDEFGVSPLFLYYEPVVHVFRLDGLEESHRTYLATRGTWDDWWQRVRAEDDRGLSEGTCLPRRGYVEVVMS
ncbi:hypothetical protein JM67_05685 [[Arthrobacter] sp. ATCC 21022]|nr:hypothetical protein JM67_05685 [Arthrobacter sp. ATCC 21022]